MVDADGTVHLKKVTIGQDYGTSLEVTGGVTPEDRIIVNPSDSLADGAKVEVAARRPYPRRPPARRRGNTTETPAQRSGSINRSLGRPPERLAACPRLTRICTRRAVIVPRCASTLMFDATRRRGRTGCRPHT